MKKAIVVLVSLCIVLALLPEAITGPDNSTYDPMADVNRDGIIDVNDLSRLGKAYGSTQTIPTQPGKTVVYVYQIESDPPEVESALVVIVDVSIPSHLEVVQFSHTNSSGIANFALIPNTNYTAIARSRTAYNYANFTTNALGEASFAVQLSYPHLPPRWDVVMIVNKTSGAIVQRSKQSLYWMGMKLRVEPDWEWDVQHTAISTAENGFAIAQPSWVGFHEKGFVYTVSVYPPEADYAPSSGYTPDENGSAFVVIYV